PGGQAEGEAAEGILHVSGAVKADKFLSQHGVSRLGVHSQNQSAKARDGLKPLEQLRHMGKLPSVYNQAHQNLPGHSSPADENMPQKALVGRLIVYSYPVLVYIIHNQVFHLLGFLRENLT